MEVVSPTYYGHPIASEQRDVKTVFFVVLLAILTCVQGVRISDVPVPFALFFGIFYIVLFRPPVPTAGPRIYTIIILYLLFVSTRNALSDTGSARDFLYVGICFTNIAITLALFDLVRAVGSRTVGTALLVIAGFEFALQMLEFFNVGGFNNLISPLLKFWAAQTNSQSFLLPGAFAQRAPGTFGSPTGAGLALYLVIRGAAIVLRRRSLVYLSIIPIVIGGARSALMIFLIWEVFAQFLIHWRRNFAFAIAGFLLLLVASVTLLAFPRLVTGLFLFRSFDVLPAQFAEGFSVVNRLRSIEWALQHWPQFVTFGGLTSAELTTRIAWQGSAVDSELVLRSLQFGLFGFLCLLVSNVWTCLYRKSPDSWFILFFAMVSSLTNSMLTDFVLFPFVIIYCLCVNVDHTDPPRRLELPA